MSTRGLGRRARACGLRVTRSPSRRAKLCRSSALIASVELGLCILDRWPANERSVGLARARGNPDTLQCALELRSDVTAIRGCLLGTMYKRREPHHVYTAQQLGGDTPRRE